MRMFWITPLGALAATALGVATLAAGTPAAQAQETDPTHFFCGDQPATIVGTERLDTIRGTDTTSTYE